MYNRFIWLFVWGLIFFTGAIQTTYSTPGPVYRASFGRQPQWGFYAHQQINRLAVFTLPADMMPFFKKHSQYLTDNAVNPDKRRYAVVGEAPRHFIDLDAYSDTSVVTLPRFYKEATDRYGPDTLALHGLVPWQIQLTKYQLTEAFRQQNVRQILRIAADLGHYIADANVPLHTTRNYNGQLTGQQGIHGFWESRLPELFSKDYDFLVGSAEYVDSPQRRAWQAVFHANAALDSVLRMERDLTTEIGETRKFGFDERNGMTMKVYAIDFSQRYHEQLRGQVERQMRASVKMVGDFWFTCWVDAGQPDMAKLAKRELSSDEDLVEVNEQKSWLKRLFSARDEN
jgi:hypothetical protein